MKAHLKSSKGKKVGYGGSVCVIVASTLIHTQTPSKQGNTSSCGCPGTESRISHNMYDTRPYYIWASMRSRCDSTDKEYNKRYGSKGVLHIKSLGRILRLLGDMKDTYSDELTLDREDTNANYCKDNCRWVDKRTQAFNTNMHCTNTSGRTGVYESGGLYYTKS